MKSHLILSVQDSTSLQPPYLPADAACIFYSQDGLDALLLKWHLQHFVAQLIICKAAYSTAQRGPSANDTHFSAVSHTSDTASSRGEFQWMLRLSHCRSSSGLSFPAAWYWTGCEEIFIGFLISLLVSNLGFPCGAESSSPSQILLYFSFWTNMVRPGAGG